MSIVESTLTDVLNAPLADVDPDVASAIDRELQSAEGAPAAAIHPALVPNFSETQEN